MDRSRWPELKRMFTDVFLSRTRAQWTAIFAGTDACVTPVLSPTEAAEHEHSRARRAFQVSSGVLHPAPAPRFDRTPPESSAAPPPIPGEHSDQVLREFGFPDDEIHELRAAKALA
jgi:alpha-methylacyl-CoA racemase